MLSVEGRKIIGRCHLRCYWGGNRHQNIIRRGKTNLEGLMSMQRLGGYVPRRSGFVSGLAVFALMTVSVLAWGQHEKEAKESKAPQHESKPSRPSGGNANRGGGQSRENQNHASRPNQGRPHQDRPNQSRPSQDRPNQGNRPEGGNRPGGNAGRPGNPGGERPGGNAGGNRPGGNAGDRGGNRPGGNAGVNRPGNAGGNRPGNAGGNRGGFACNSGGAAGRPAPGRNVSLRGGGTASIRPNGQIRTINRNGMVIHNNLRGGRTIVTQRNGVRVVSTGRGYGYVQRSYVVRGGRSFYSRTYYDHGVYRVGIYRGYYWGGRNYYGYYPGYWYHPGFYGWAYHPWNAPVRWTAGIGGWGWAGTRWYGYYGGYFAPFPVYLSAAFWLPDYLIAADLQAAYAARPEAGADDAATGYEPAQTGDASSGSPALTPEVKQAIAEEVKAQLAAEQQQSGQSGNSSDGAQDAQSHDAQAQAPAS